MDELSLADQTVSRSELDDAAKAIEATENEDLEDIFRSQGDDEVVSALAEEDNQKADSEPMETRPVYTYKPDPVTSEDAEDEASEDREPPKPFKKAASVSEKKAPVENTQKLNAPVSQSNNLAQAKA